MTRDQDRFIYGLGLLEEVAAMDIGLKIDAKFLGAEVEKVFASKKVEDGKHQVRLGPSPQLRKTILNRVSKLPH